MQQVIIKIVLASLLSHLTLSHESNEIDNIDIYWREYNGIVPEDAVPGGHDINNRTTYIGQGFLNESGIEIGMIYPGVDTIDVPFAGRSIPVTTYVKILCSGHKDSFRWIPATSNNFFNITIDKYPVPGGYEHFYTLNIGRIAMQGELVVGKIATAAPDFPGIAPLFIGVTDKEIQMNSYEALIYVPEEIVPKTDNIDIYWRVYNGTVPKDAVPGGHDINNRTTYIGQGTLNDTGIEIGIIYPGVAAINIPLGGLSIPVTSYVNILCSRHKESFRWIPSTSDTFHMIMIDKYPVRGGYEHAYTRTLNIGRVEMQGEVVVGKIVTAVPNFPGIAPMFIVNSTEEIQINSYEALIYVPEATVEH